MFKELADHQTFGLDKQVSFHCMNLVWILTLTTTKKDLRLGRTMICIDSCPGGLKTLWLTADTFWQDWKLDTVGQHFCGCWKCKELWEAVFWSSRLFGWRFAGRTSLKSMHILDIVRLHMLYASLQHWLRNVNIAVKRRRRLHAVNSWLMALWSVLLKKYRKTGVKDSEILCVISQKELTERWRHWWGGALEARAVPKQQQKTCRKNIWIKWTKGSNHDDQSQNQKTHNRSPTNLQRRVFFTGTAQKEALEFN